MDTFEKRVTDSFGEEDPEFNAKLENASEDLREASEKLRLIRNQCQHPKKYIKVQSEDYPFGDGYGGTEWMHKGYTVKCSLCGGRAGVLKYENNEYSGDDFLIEILRKLQLEVREYERKITEDRIRKEEMEELARLQEKYKT